MQKWIPLFEAPATQILPLERQILASPASIERDRQLFYIQVLKSFHRHDAVGIQSLLQEKASWLVSHLDLKLLSQLLYLFRIRSTDIQKITALYAGSKRTSALFQAEISLVAAAALHFNKQFELSEKIYREASLLFESSGAHKKSMRALLSAISTRSCSRPNSRLYFEYMSAHKKALAFGDYISAASALTQISQEFQALGSQDTALDYISNAIDLLNQHALGAREYGLALAHRAHIHLDSKSYANAHQDLTYALTVPHVEVQSACENLAKKFHLNLKTLRNRKPLANPLRPKLRVPLSSLAAIQKRSI